jgi:hypothetical protein
LLLLFCPAAIRFFCSAINSWMSRRSQPSQPASQPAGRGEEAAVCNREVWFGLVLFCFAFPCFLVLISGILLPTARRTAPGIFLFHVPLLLFLFYCCWLQCHNTVVGLVRELFFFFFSCEHYNSFTERSAVIEELLLLQTGLLK